MPYVTGGGGKALHAVFMCHLAVEKALKGLYFERRNEFPPKSHSLVFLLNEIGVNPPENLGRFMVRLSEASIPTRYPENLSNVQKEFTETIVKDILARSKGIILWIKAQL
ncbi:MAG: HEPN domain-containing protein [Geobacteraceae bacterium]|nr:MAG: HEPN domain-containing protein [Geobacteraceae bacterium]